LANIDYVEIVDGKTVQPVEKLSGEVLIALAVKFGKTRLIDNIILEV
jgi:pantoate--beta-alanine ligase